MTEQSANNDSAERVLLYDFWKSLGGEEGQEVQVRHTTTFITAILRMTDNKLIGTAGE